ncbi:MAG: hypothetical protein JL50_15500 [Peptococcaceae bacterium BICA1-7]|nr:MAG: hypothetical protein JL50_15500 [Peptococcaceae bacterium BICA1-7]HBV96807.1 hypothetical protein [Desulfotomaculum sp.]
MESRRIFYDLLLYKIQSQIFYNSIMVRMVNPMARDLFKTFRDEDERDVVNIRKLLLSIESKPEIFKTFLPGNTK